MTVGDLLPRIGQVTDVSAADALNMAGSVTFWAKGAEGSGVFVADLSQVQLHLDANNDGTSDATDDLVKDDPTQPGKGHRGDFGLYSWPTEYTPNPLTDPGNYNRSELVAWKSAPELLGVLGRCTPLTRAGALLRPSSGRAYNGS